MVVKFKKRIFVAIILTIITLVLTNNFWLTRKPIEVSFDIEGKGKYEIKAYLNAINNEYFRDSKIVKKEIELAKKETIVGKYNLQKGKRFKIDFKKNSLANASNIYIYISNLNFRKGKFKITDYENFISENANLKADENGLKIIPKTQDFSVIYKPKLKLRAAIKFQIEIFIIIAVLSFLLFSKLLDYAADFKTIKHKSRIEILFLVCFFIILFIPMLHIDDSVNSRQENRTLASWKPFINEDKEINFNFGKDFDSWFNDRFNLRSKLVDLHHATQHTISGKIYQKDNYIWNKKNNWILAQNNTPECKNAEIQQTFIDNIKHFQKYTSSKGIKFYILIAPHKEFIYYDKLSPYVELPKVNNLEIVNKIKNTTNIKIVYPYEEFIKNKDKEYLHFKTDHHWTDIGAFIAYQELVKEIKKDFPSYKAQTIDDFVISENNQVRAEYERTFSKGSTSNIINLKNKKIFDVNYKYLSHKDSTSMETNDSKQAQYRYYKYKNSKNNLSALIFGNSMAENLTPILSYDFKESTKARSNNIYNPNGTNKEYGYTRIINEITKFKSPPNIIIFVITEHSISKRFLTKED